MTVEKLIEMLKKHDPKAELYVWDAETDIVSYVDSVVEDSLGFICIETISREEQA